MWIETFLMYVTTILVLSVTSMYIYFKYKYKYWQKENIVHLEPQFPFGNTKGIILLSEAFGDSFLKIYREIKKQTKSFGGFYMFSRPVIMLIDPELVKNVITKDFGHFHDRGMFVDEEADPLGAHLVALKGLKWKNSRAKITPTFTSGKMKMMFHTMLATCNELTNIVDQHIEDRKSIDMKDIFARLSTDTIGSCAFGLDCNSLKDPNVEFRKYGKRVFEFGFRDAFINMLATNFPFILRWFKIPQTHPDVTKFFMNVLKETIDYREANKVNRKDFLDLLIKLKNNQSIWDEDAPDSKTLKEGISFNELAAHAFVFFAAGFETTSSTLNFCIFELSKDLAIQEKVRKEVVHTLEKHNGEINYEGIMSMKYMDKVFNEVLRKYPPIPMLERECTVDYPVPNTDYVIKKGTEVVISTLALQHDPEHYPDPDKFDPERFSDKQKADRHPYTFLPFGEGPRVCIGLRFALLQVKIVLSVLLKDYKFTLDSKTNNKVEFSSSSFFLSPKDTVWIQAQKINE